jgi:RHS repeat-associated protein
MTGYSTGADNRMSNDGLWTYTYDADGNIIKKSKGASSDTWVYTYNNNNQMVSAAYSATNGGTVTDLITYVYDAFGNKIERDEWNGSTTTVQRYALDGWNPAKQDVQGNDNFDTWADLNGSNTITMRRGFGAGIDELIYREDSSGNVGWYLTDHLGSVIGITDGSGSPLTTISYNGWGKVLSNSNSAQSDRYLYTGREWDGSLGLQYNRARFYDSTTGIWYQEDPSGLTTGPNIHEYVNNHPTNATDPSGLAEMYAGAAEGANDFGETDPTKIREVLGRVTVNSKDNDGKFELNKNGNTIYDRYLDKIRKGTNNQGLITVKVYRPNGGPLRPSGPFILSTMRPIKGQPGAYHIDLYGVDNVTVVVFKVKNAITVRNAADCHSLSLRVSGYEFLGKTVPAWLLGKEPDLLLPGETAETIFNLPELFKQVRLDDIQPGDIVAFYPTVAGQLGNNVWTAGMLIHSFPVIAVQPPLAPAPRPKK